MPTDRSIYKLVVSDTENVDSAAEARTCWAVIHSPVPQAAHLRPHYREPEMESLVDTDSKPSRRPKKYTRARPQRARRPRGHPRQERVQGQTGRQDAGSQRAARR